MSFDAQNLISPAPVKTPVAQAARVDVAASSDIKTRFDRVMQAQSVEPVANAQIDVESETVGTELLSAVLSVSLPSDLPDLAEALPDISPTQTLEPSVSEDTTTVADAQTAVGQATVKTLADALKAPEFNLAVDLAPDASVAKPTVAAVEPPLDLAATLMAAQLAVEEVKEAVPTEAEPEVEALLKTLPPEIQAQLQALVRTTTPVSDTKAAATTATASDETGDSTGDKAKPADPLPGLLGEKGTDKATLGDPSLSAVKDVNAMSAEDAALPAVAVVAQTQTTPTVPTSPSDAQALIGNLSSRLNGGVAASSTASAGIAQAYVMSDQTADNIAALATQIHKRIDAKSMRFDMELRPSDMGRVDVRLDIGHDGKLSAHLSFDSPVAETEFRGRSDDLRRQLEQSGFSLEDGALSFSSRDQGGNRQPQQPETPVSASVAADAFADSESLSDSFLNPHFITDHSHFTGPNFFTGQRLALNLRV